MTKTQDKIEEETAKFREQFTLSKSGHLMEVSNAYPEELDLTPTSQRAEDFLHTFALSIIEAVRDEVEEEFIHTRCGDWCPYQEEHKRWLPLRQKFAEIIKSLEKKDE